MTTAASPEFMQFVNYMQCSLSDTNSTILTNLYVNFNSYQPPVRCGSFAEKFIFWKQLYDQYAQEQEKIANANLFASQIQPSDPRLKAIKTELPEDLTSLCVKSEDTQLFQTFDLKNETPTTPQSQHNSSDACNTEIKSE
ncbi:Hypothetical predicted protein [Paramuricea clavata]|uniref:Uncharacterized protein n=1 Tax=Paramuricea clavata TaxID=317549 RepID=A0A7D9LC43_PARCT|nr:Hypothetical predicted protein [Paramuricea clavata]